MGRIGTLILAILVTLTLVACRGITPSPTPLPSLTPTSLPTPAQEPTATSTSEPTPTPTPHCDRPARPDGGQERSPSWPMVGQVGGRTEAVAVQGNYAYVAGGLRLVVLDVSDPTRPQEIGSTMPFPEFVEGVAVSGSLAYVADGMAGLRIVDVCDPTHPVEVGAYDSAGYAEGVAVASQYAYVADGHYGLRIVDISDPRHPTEAAYAYPLNYVFAVAVGGQYAYLAAAGAGLLAVDVADPAHPIEVGTYDTPGYAYGVDVADNMVYVADGWEGVRVVNVSDPAHAVEVGSYDTPGWAFGVDAVGTNAYVADAFAGLRVLDVSRPWHPTEVGGYEVSGGHAGSVAAVGNTAYVADRNWGLRLIDVSDPGALTQIGYYAPLGYAAAVAVSGNYAYVAAGIYGLRVVEISDPAHAVEIGAYDTQGNAIGVAVVGSYAYVAVMCPDVGSGLHVVDVSDPAHPTRAEYLAPSDGCYRDIAVVGGIAYIANEWEVELIDVSSPRTPVLTGITNLSNGVNAITTAVDVSGTLAYVSGVEGLFVVDVSNPVSPTLISHLKDYAGAESDFDVAVAETTLYVTHHGGVNLKIIDASDPLRPVPQGVYLGPSLPERVAVVNSTAYVAFGSGGLYGIDVSDPLSPILAVSYDTPGYAIALAVAGDTMYVADADAGLVILDMGGGESEVSGLTRGKPASASAGLCNASVTQPPTRDSGENTSLFSGAGDRIGEQARSRPHHQPDTQSTLSTDTMGRTCVVTSTADSGSGTLRKCMDNAMNGDAITFAPGVFPPDSPATITLKDNLPMIRCGNLTIDASDAGVILDGSQIQSESGGTGLNIASDNNVIRGLQILHFSNTGIWLDPGASHNTIGGDRTLGRGPMGQGNLISGNYIGISVAGGGNVSNTILGNFIGTDISGLHALGNQDVGVQVSHASYNRIGGTSPQERNIISAAGRHGINLQDSSGNVIVGNYVGTDVNGTVDLGNGEHGVALELASFNNVVKDNLISGNDMGGVVISDWASSYNSVVGNLIGTDASGMEALGNGRSGVAVGFGGASFNRIGGTWPEDANVISGNLTGIELHGREAGNLILGNLIGTNISGTGAIRNDQGVVVVDDSSHSFIGGSTDAERNVISGNGSVGIDVTPGERIFIMGNYIGTDVGGTLALANGGSGVNTAGKHSVIQGNVIAGNRGGGVSLGHGSDFSHLRANRIGVATDGMSPLPNGMAGVSIEAASNVVGGPYPEDGNIIAFNANVGVQVSTYSGNTVRRNSAHGNSYAGIYLANGGNNSLTAPIITDVAPGSVSGTACPGCIVEVFSDEADEGQMYEGYAIADGSGIWTWAGSPDGPCVTATATDEAGNTSPFSAPKMVAAERGD
jgi:parallel beta-helix repeat protein